MDMILHGTRPCRVQFLLDNFVAVDAELVTIGLPDTKSSTINRVVLAVLPSALRHHLVASHHGCYNMILAMLFSESFMLTSHVRCLPILRTASLLTVNEIPTMLRILSGFALAPPPVETLLVELDFLAL